MNRTMFIGTDLYYSQEFVDDIISELKEKDKEIEKLHSIIKEVREEVKIYEEQSNDGATNELDNYVFVQRLKKVLDKENI